MNRQIVILFISVIILVASGIWEVNYLQSTSYYIRSDLSYSKNALENQNFEAALQQVKEMKENWNHIRPIWNIFIEHDEIDELEMAMTECLVYLEQQNKEEALKYVEILDRHFTHIPNKQNVSIETVF